MSLFLVCSLVGTARAQDDDAVAPPAIRDSVVLIEVKYRGPNFQRPWTPDPPTDFAGTGFVIEGNRIITNAHVAEYAREVYVQGTDSSERYPARVTALATGPDIAVLELRERDAEAFFAAHPPLKINPELPDLGEAVQVVGYPQGGNQQSMTEGVVSRIEYTNYYDDFAALTIQVDAAINPGNSGGPAIAGDSVIGMVFSYFPDAENMGYIIPAEDILRFLDDVEDGTYDGPPLLSAHMQTLENAALRDRLGLDASMTGLMVTHDDDADAGLRAWDVITHIGEHDIDNDGMVELRPGLRVAWSYYLPLLGAEGTLPLRVVRDGETISLDVPLRSYNDQLVPYLDGAYPQYFIYGPLVFTRAYADVIDEWVYLSYLAQVNSPLPVRKDELPAFEGEELVIAPASLLSHPIGKGYQVGHYPTLRAVNGTPIRSLAHLVEVLRDLDDEYVVFEWHDQSQETFVFHREDIEASTEDILEENGIRHQMSRNLRDVWEVDG